MYLIVVLCPTAVVGAECSGHGVCWDMADIAAYDGLPAEVYGSTPTARSSTAWDFDVMRACVCNSSWAVGYEAGEYQLAEYYSPDCSLSKYYRIDCPAPFNVCTFFL